jgi:hypothetical protein
VLAENPPYRPLVHPEVDTRVDRDTVLSLLSNRHPRGLLVGADTVFVQLRAEALVLVYLEHREHEHHEVGRPDDREHFLSVAPAAGCPLDEPRHVEELNVRPPVLEHPGVDIDSGELVGTGLAVGVRQRVQEGRLSDTREPDECNRRVTGLLDRVPRPTAR